MILAIVKEPAEAGPLTAWALRFAAAQEDKTVRIVYAPRTGVTDEIGAALDAPCAAQPDVAATCDTLEGPNRLKAILFALRESKPSLVMLARPAASRKTDHGEHVLTQRLFESIPGAVMLFRLGGEVAANLAHPHVLVPAAGGRHSREALREAARLAANGDSEITPLYVEPDVGEVSTDVGARILDRALTAAGIKLRECTNFHPKVVVADRPEDGIRAMMDEHPYDLVLLGASERHPLRRHLFSTLPERFLGAKHATNIAVIRMPRPVGRRMRDAAERILRLRVPQLRRDDRVALFEEIQTKSRWSFDFMTLIFLSTAIAAIGLIQNSTAVVIGAMLVAPLMTPLLGAGLALMQGNLPLMKSCARSILFGFCGAVTVGFLTGLVLPITELTPELLARGQPSLLDMGVAFLSGIAASYCMARPGLASALAGVAIAAALVPPIATTGISLALGAVDNGIGAALLFATNVLSIMAGASLNFYAAGIRTANRDNVPKLWARRTIIGLAIGIAALAVPLGSVLVLQFMKHRDPTALPRPLTEEVKAEVARFDPRAKIVGIAFEQPFRRPSRILITLESPVAPDDALARRIAAHARRHFGAENEDAIAVRLETRLVASNFVEKEAATTDTPDP